MSEKPERVWVDDEWHGAHAFAWENRLHGTKEYIRADIHDAEVARLWEALKGRDETIMYILNREKGQVDLADLTYRATMLQRVRELRADVARLREALEFCRDIAWEGIAEQTEQDVMRFIHIRCRKELGDWEDDDE